MEPRGALISATADLLWERGYTATSPALIQQRSGIGHGSMYHHFSGKPDLVRAAMEHIAEQMRHAVLVADDPERTCFERIKVYLSLERAPLRGCRLGRLVHDCEIVTDDTVREVIAGFFQWIEDRLVEVLQAGQRAGEVAVDAVPQELAAMVVAVVQGGYILARALNDDEHQRAAVRGAIAALDALARPRV